MCKTITESKTLSLKLFVYGTLRQDESNHHFLSGAKLLLKDCRAEGMLYDTGLGYPVLVEDKSGCVKGELYMITNGHLHEIDRLEGYVPGGDCYYDRATKPVFTEDGEVGALVYLWRRPVTGMKLIPSGDWKKRNN